jgi:hypothetical protein
MYQEWAHGVSVYDSLDAAIARARTARFRLGRWIVVLAVPGGAKIRLRKTGKDEHHFTMFASAEDLIALVTGSSIYVWDEGDDV